MEGQIRGKARRACDGYDDDGERMVLSRGTSHPLASSFVGQARAIGSAKQD